MYFSLKKRKKEKKRGLQKQDQNVLLEDYL